MAAFGAAFWHLAAFLHDIRAAARPYCGLVPRLFSACAKVSRTYLKNAKPMLDEARGLAERGHA
jgi:hypothetical protein